MSQTQCGPGKILKNGYRRKGYKREEYVNKNGVYIPATYISAADVPPTCVKDMGKPGKGKKTLPDLRDDFHLTSYGYSIHRPVEARRASLRAAAKDNGTLDVLRHLNLIRNKQPIVENKKIFSDDVEYMKKLYRREKNQLGGQFANQLGGITRIEDPLSSIDENINDNTKSKVIMKSSEKKCKDNVCHIHIYESHEVDGRLVEFFTLKEENKQSLIELDKLCLNYIKNKIPIDKLFDNNDLHAIGIKVDGKLEGFCIHREGNDKTVYIERFCVNKGYGTPLHEFVENYLSENGYRTIVVTICIEDTNIIREMNFWFIMGFTANEVKQSDGKSLIIMNKHI